ncbi:MULTISPECIES: MmyB family transcriptional regulator [unclassified Agarivorans]|uniref:MmyB family transcriptional regulator n=1 Tax=unclassified Agarivorans TaxID=2636026 RepID=UPI003D7E9383
MQPTICLVSSRPSERRNLLPMLFTNPALREIFLHREEEAPPHIIQCRRDHANTSHDSDIKALEDELKNVSADFNQCWKQHDVHALCDGTRKLKINGETATFEHTSLINRHFRLVVDAKSE